MGFPRVEALRARFLAREKVGSTSDEMRYLFAKGWMDHRNEWVTARRYTLARAEVYLRATPTIDNGELIVGRPNHEVRLTDEESKFLALAEAMIPRRSGQDSHMAIDYEKLLDKGTDGVRAEVLAHKALLDVVGRPEDIEKETFYDDCLTMLSAVEALAERYADFAEALAGSADAPRAEELRLIARNLRRVPKYPASTFYEALQSVHFLTFGLQGLYQMGRPDQYLLRFYRRDVQAGTLTREFAQELIDCFCLLYDEYISKGLAVGLMVGGRYPDGTDVDNELTEMFLQSIFDVRLSYPGVGLCVTPRTSDKLMRLACRALAEGHSHPALFNDEVIARGLMGYGLPFDEAVSYIHSTCVEITPIKRSAVWVASPYYNLMEPLLALINGGEAGRAAGLEELVDLYQCALRERIRAGVYEQNRLQMERDAWYSNPLVSCFVDDCLARGRDLDHGGARYHFIESSFVGMANLVDALLAIDRIVFSEKRLTMEGFAEVLTRNFEGDEPLRQYILNKCPQYGNDDPEADRLFARMTRWVTDEMDAYRTWRGSRFIPSMFCWVMHAELGKHTQATPDGRLCGFPLGDGSGPAQGRERRGPTASVLSSTSWPHERFIGGIAVNMKFSRSLMSGEAIDKMMALVRAFMARGGFELQINAVDRQKLLEAQKHPDQYRDLVVRIGGYSDYFTNLSPEMQREVLLRTEHEL